MFLVTIHCLGARWPSRRPCHRYESRNRCPRFHLRHLTEGGLPSNPLTSTCSNRKSFRFVSDLHLAQGLSYKLLSARIISIPSTPCEGARSITPVPCYVAPKVAPWPHLFRLTQNISGCSCHWHSPCEVMQMISRGYKHLEYPGVGNIGLSMIAHEAK